MSEDNPEINEELKKLVSTSIASVKEGLKGKECSVIGLMHFELAVVTAKEAKGGFKFLNLADCSGQYSKECMSKIQFDIIGTNTEIGRRLGASWLDK
jgi:hypothetical protein